MPTYQNDFPSMTLTVMMMITMALQGVLQGMEDGVHFARCLERLALLLVLLWMAWGNRALLL